MNHNNTPDFIIAGAPKCGSSLVYQLLKKNQLVCMSQNKEPNIYYKNWQHADSIQLYNDISLNCLKGEATIGYFDKPEVAERIFSTNPETKIIFCLRNPIDRTYSHYWHGVKGGYEKRSWEQILQNPDLKEYLFSYSFYYRNITYFTKYFSKQNIHIFLLEDFEKNPNKTANELLVFLNLPVVKEISSKKENEGKAFKNIKIQFFLKKINSNKNLLPSFVRQFGKSLFLFLQKKNVQSKDNLKKLTQDQRKQLSNLFKNDVTSLFSVFNMNCPWKEFNDLT